MSTSAVLAQPLGWRLRGAVAQQMGEPVRSLQRLGYYPYDGFGTIPFREHPGGDGRQASTHR